MPQETEAELTVVQATGGLDLRLAFDVRLHGPCMRCLADAALDIHVDAREYHAADPAPATSSAASTSSTTSSSDGWARDAIALAMPDQILHAPDCAGLCPVCGKDLNVEPHAHEDEDLDPRWSALEELRDRL